MSIEDIKEKKREAEAKINQIITDLYRSTGMHADSIAISYEEGFGITASMFCGCEIKLVIK